MDNTQLMQQNFCINMLEKICNLSAVLDIGNYQLTLQELAKFCIYKLDHNRIRSHTDLQFSIKEKFNFDFDIHIIESRFQVQSATPSPWVLASSKKTS